jgi:hypothetical protein
MSPTKSDARRVKSVGGFGTKARAVVTASALGIGAVSTAAAMTLVPAATSAAEALGGFAVHNPVLLGVVALFAVGHSGVVASLSGSNWGKPSEAKTGATGVACSRCYSVFRNEAEIERHSWGYHV